MRLKIFEVLATLIDEAPFMFIQLWSILNGFFWPKMIYVKRSPRLYGQTGHLPNTWPLAVIFFKPDSFHAILMPLTWDAFNFVAATLSKIHPGLAIFAGTRKKSCPEAFNINPI